MAALEEIIVNDYGCTIGKHSERLSVKKKGHVVTEAPLLHLKRVWVCGRGVTISTDLIEACCERGIAIHLLDTQGSPTALLSAPGVGGTVLSRREQPAAYHDGRGAQIALAIAEAKIRSSAATLRYTAKGRRETDPGMYQRLHEAANDCAAETERLLPLHGLTLEELRPRLMAAEAQAALRSWSALREVVPAAYGWTGRITQGAADPINNLLNYGYGILRARVEGALMIAGLDPYGGFIHTDRPGRVSLALDMMEEFRSIAVERLVIGLATRHYQVEMAADGRLSDDSRRDFAEKVLKHLQATVRYTGARFPIAQVILEQATRLASHLRGELPAYVPYTVGE